MVYTIVLGKTREKGIHHRSGKKGIHHRGLRPEKEKRRVSTVVVYTFIFPALLPVVIHYSNYSQSVQNVVIHYIFSSDSLCVVTSLQIVNSLRVLFLVCRGPSGGRTTFAFPAAQTP